MEAQAPEAEPGPLELQAAVRRLAEAMREAVGRGDTAAAAVLAARLSKDSMALGPGPPSEAPTRSWHFSQ